MSKQSLKLTLILNIIAVIIFAIAIIIKEGYSPLSGFLAVCIIMEIWTLVLVLNSKQNN